ncbi:hypothetical protein L1887_40459 [Cichorium endivia]|nr:hypothetical protein L1887_40459 [Cichorium endivia]
MRRFAKPKRQRAERETRADQRKTVTGVLNHAQRENDAKRSCQRRSGKCIEREGEKEGCLEEPGDKLAPGGGGNVLLGLVLGVAAARVEIDLGKLDHLGLVPELPTDPRDEEDGDAKVGAEEARGEPARVGLQPRAVRQLGAVVALERVGLAEAQVGVAARGPGKQTCHGRQSREPREDGSTTGADAEVGQGTDEPRDTDSNVGNAALVDTAQDAGRLSVERHGVHGACWQRRCTRNRRRMPRSNHRVEDVRQHGDARVLHGNDPGRGAGVGAVALEARVVVGHDEDP